MTIFGKEVIPKLAYLLVPYFLALTCQIGLVVTIFAFFLVFSQDPTMKRLNSLREECLSLLDSKDLVQKLVLLVENIARSR